MPPLAPRRDNIRPSPALVSLLKVVLAAKSEEHRVAPKLLASSDRISHLAELDDIREQYPLDREITQTIAQELKIRHPHYPGTHVPTVMTVDFLLTVVQNGEELSRALPDRPFDIAFWDGSAR